MLMKTNPDLVPLPEPPLHVGADKYPGYFTLLQLTNVRILPERARREIWRGINDEVVYAARTVHSAAKQAQQQFITLAKKKLQTEREKHGLQGNPFAVFLKYSAPPVVRRPLFAETPAAEVLSVNDAQPLCEIINNHVTTEGNTSQLHHYQHDIGIFHQRAVHSARCQEQMEGVWLWDKRALRQRLLGTLTEQCYKNAKDAKFKTVVSVSSLCKSTEMAFHVVIADSTDSSAVQLRDVVAAFEAASATRRPHTHAASLGLLQAVPEYWLLSAWERGCAPLLWLDLVPALEELGYTLSAKDNSGQGATIHC
jgi:hypothetical protein